MHHFAYRNGVLHAEAVDLVALAQAVGTPFYCYASATLERHYRVFADAFADVDALVCYAMKANSNQAVIATLARLGAGADVVSGGELLRARAAGIPPGKIMFSGVGKTADELKLAVEQGILCVNVESEAELELLAAIAAGAGSTAAVSIRVNPDIDPKTHAKICHRQGREQIRHSHQPRPRGLCSRRQAQGRARRRRRHAYRQPDHRARSVQRRFRAAGGLRARAARRRSQHQPRRSRRRLGIPYRDDNEPPPDPAAYAAIVKRATQGLGCKLIFEPGRLIVGNAGILVTRVLYVKRGEAKTFVIVDAGMNDLVRPTLYEAYHDIRPIREPAIGAPRIIADVVGPVCESGDYLALDRSLNEPKPGDLLAVMTAGAYGAVEASTYNTRALVPEVLVRAGEWALVRPRVIVEELIALDRLPPWL